MKSLGLWLTSMTMGHELRALNAMNRDDRSYFELLDHGFRCYEQLRVMDDMNESGSYEFGPLDHTNSSRL